MMGWLSDTVNTLKRSFGFAQDRVSACHPERHTSLQRIQTQGVGGVSVGRSFCGSSDAGLGALAVGSVQIGTGL